MGEKKPFFWKALDFLDQYPWLLGWIASTAMTFAFYQVFGMRLFEAWVISILLLVFFLVDQILRILKSGQVVNIQITCVKKGGADCADRRN